MKPTSEYSISFIDDSRAQASRTIAKLLFRQLDLGMEPYPYPGETVEISDGVTLWNLACVESVDYSNTSIENETLTVINVRYHSYDLVKSTIGNDIDFQQWIKLQPQEFQLDLETSLDALDLLAAAREKYDKEREASNPQNDLVKEILGL